MHDHVFDDDVLASVEAMPASSNSVIEMPLMSTFCMPFPWMPWCELRPIPPVPLESVIQRFLAAPKGASSAVNLLGPCCPMKGPLPISITAKKRCAK